jgi:ribosomal-protein-alanine N-acetyltransferase
MQAIRDRMKKRQVKYYAASYAGHTVGFVDFQFVGRKAKILGLAVLPEFRGNGIGKKLLKKALEEARKAGKSEAFLWTSRKMYPDAQALYEKFGFQFKEAIPQKIFGEEIIVLSKKL